MLTFKQFLLITLAISLINAQKKPEDRNMTMGDINVKALGHSGKIRIQKEFKTENKTETNTVTLDFSSLRELDQDGNQVGKSGKIKHSYNNFAQLDFTVGKVNQIQYQNLSASTFDFTATGMQDINTKFNANLYIFNQTGEIKNGNETSNVKPGAVKLSIGVNNWRFCTLNATCPGVNCCQQGNKTETGKFLEFEMVIKGNNTAISENNKTFSLGGSELVLFQDIQIDGKWSSMPQGFPKYNNATNTYTFRFPRFNSSLMYDPLVTYAEIEPESSSSNVWIYIVIGVVVVVLAVSAVLFFRKKGGDEKKSQFIEN